MFEINFSTSRLAVSLDAMSLSVRIGTREYLLTRDYIHRDRTPSLFEMNRDALARSWEALVVRRWLVSGSSVTSV